MPRHPSPVVLCPQADFNPGDKMITIVKHGIAHLVHLRPMEETKGMILGLDSKDLRDEADRVV